MSSGPKSKPSNASGGGKSSKLDQQEKNRTKPVRKPYCAVHKDNSHFTSDCPAVKEAQRSLEQEESIPTRQTTGVSIRSQPSSRRNAASTSIYDSDDDEEIYLGRTKSSPGVHIQGMSFIAKLPTMNHCHTGSFPLTETMRMFHNSRDSLSRYHVAYDSGASGDFNGICRVAYHPDAVANVISALVVRDQPGFRVGYDFEEDYHWIDCPDGSCLEFHRFLGLCICDFSYIASERTNTGQAKSVRQKAAPAIASARESNTVEDNLKTCSAREQRELFEARMLQKRLGYSGSAALQQCLNQGVFQNAPVAARSLQEVQ
eukprot:gene42164-biopygen8031